MAIDARPSSNIIEIRSMVETDGDTDHILVRAKIRIKISSWKHKRTEPTVKWHVGALKYGRSL